MHSYKKLKKKKISIWQVCSDTCIKLRAQKMADAGTYENLGILLLIALTIQFLNFETLTIKIYQNL